MSARTVRRSFASPFVVTLAALPAACMVQSAPSRPPPPDRMQPASSTAQPAEPAPGPAPTVMANPPPPPPNPAAGSMQQPPDRAPPPGDRVQMGAQDERHWTVMRQGDKCSAYEAVSCPPQASCNPPPPRAYACSPEITPTEPLKIVQHAGATTCMIDRPLPSCPPNMRCNPPPPKKVDCPQ